MFYQNVLTAKWMLQDIDMKDTFGDFSLHYVYLSYESELKDYAIYVIGFLFTFHSTS